MDGKDLKSELQLFEGCKVRTAWDEEAQEWFFSVVDVVAVLTDSADPKQYIKKMRARDPELNDRWGTICTPTRMMASDGKYYNTQAADMQGMFEPFKQWMAQVAAQRVDQMLDPELLLSRQSQIIEGWGIRSLGLIRWKRGGVTESIDFATLTDLMSKTWSGMTTRDYKRHKGLTPAGMQYYL